jgi:tRNA pseudouridine55 synthase
VVHQIKKTLHLTKHHKIGHTGTLDPFATGLLPLAIGHGTKFCDDLLMQSKTYHATLQLGFSSSTGDSEGVITPFLQSNANPNADSNSELNEITIEIIKSVLETFMGASEQIPPMNSALKQNGIRLYDLARQGIEVERPARNIFIHELEILSFDAINYTLIFSVHCSSGTYVRTLGEDIAKKLGTQGYLKELRRTQIGDWHVDDGFSISDFQKLQKCFNDDIDDENCSVANNLETNNQNIFIAIDNPLQHFPSFAFQNNEKERFLNGQRFFFPELVEQSLNGVMYRIYADKTMCDFLGLAWIENGRMQPKKVLK